MFSAPSLCILPVTHIDTYRAAKFVVAIEIINPTIPRPKDSDICQKRSCVLSECLCCCQYNCPICQSHHAPRPDKRKQCRKQEGRCNQHQRHRWTVSQCGSQRWEVRAERQGNGLRHQHESQPPHLPVCNGKPEPVPLSSGLLLITYTYILFHSLYG
jgi:hypothetical protein